MADTMQIWLNTGFRSSGTQRGDGNQHFSGARIGAKARSPNPNPFGLLRKHSFSQPLATHSIILILHINRENLGVNTEREQDIADRTARPSRAFGLRGRAGPALLCKVDTA